ncbi:hypothetical protein [Pseudomonas zeae]|uniref:hypothetical protein n=1 Tax=Pseudomonas zeae TaxID=2745510 RepID=UPI0039E0FA5E
MARLWSVVSGFGAAAMLCIGCSGPAQDLRPLILVDTGMRPQDIRVRADQVSRVNATAVAGDAVVVTLYSRLDTQNAFSFSLPREQVKAGYRVDDYYDHDTTLTVTARWNGQHYLESTQFPTYAHFVVISLSPEEAVLEVSARLFKQETDTFINLPLTLLKIQGADLATLTARPMSPEAAPRTR